MSRKRIVILAVVLIDLIIIAVVIAVVLDRNRDAERRDAFFAATSTTEAVSPYDLTEMPAETDPEMVEGASFISILVPNEAGTLTSYGISADLATAQALVTAILEAEEVEITPAGPDTTTAGVSTPTLTFVFPTRETLTFVLDLAQGTISRGEQTWRPGGDLRALVEAATAAP
jgi:hypothetical protein